MANINWGEIIAYVLRSIADGLDKGEAISEAPSKFRISKSAILKKYK